MLKQKDIVIFPFPYTNFSKTKSRPAIVISNNKHNSGSNDVVLVAITSNLKNEPYSININDSNLDEGFLIKESRIKTDHLFSVDKIKIQKQIGKINNKTFQKIKNSIFQLISPPQ